MKRVILILLGLLLLGAAHSQHVDLTKLPQEEREKRLFEIAAEAMKKYAPSYYKEDIKPRIRYQGIATYEKDKYFGKMVYSVEFPFDLGKAMDEGREGENVYGGSVAILGETGKAIFIRPTDWMVKFTIDDEIETRSGTHKVAEPTRIPRPFKIGTIVVDSNDQIIKIREND